MFLMEDIMNDIIKLSRFFTLFEPVKSFSYHARLLTKVNYTDHVTVC